MLELRWSLVCDGDALVEAETPLASAEPYLTRMAAAQGKLREAGLEARRTRLKEQFDRLGQPPQLGIDRGLGIEV